MYVILRVLDLDIYLFSALYSHQSGIRANSFLVAVLSFVSFLFGAENIWLQEVFEVEVVGLKDM